MKKVSCSEIVTLPNCITTLRIIGALCLAFTVPLSIAYFVIYTLCGLSDVLDGWIARSTNSTSDLGARLDSVADLLFYIVMMVKLLPTLWRLLPTWIWYMLGGVLLLRFASYVTAAIKFRRFASMHTRLNKLTGLAVFFLPYFLALPRPVVYCFFTCAIGGAASGQELILHLCRSEYQDNKKALF